MLKGCDFDLAALVLASQFEGKVIKKELAALIDEYIKNSCLETAVAIIKYGPNLVLTFHECKPGGFWTRYKSEMVNNMKRKLPR